MNSWRRKKKLTINGAFFFSAGYSIQGSGQYSNRGPFFAQQGSLEKKREVHSELCPFTIAEFCETYLPRLVGVFLGTNYCFVARLLC